MDGNLIGSAIDPNMNAVILHKGFCTNLSSVQRYLLTKNINMQRPAVVDDETVVTKNVNPHVRRIILQH